MDELESKVASYDEQLSQVEALVASDPRNEQFLKLRSDLVEIKQMTEDLIKSKKASSGQQEEEEEEVALPPSKFEVGMRCEARYQDSFYPALITKINGRAHTVVFIGFGNTEVVEPQGLRHMPTDQNLEDLPIVGFECSAKYSGDGKWYDAVVEQITDLGYRVKFVEYGNSEEVPFEYLRNRTATEMTRAPDGTYQIPETLKVQATDSEADRARKRRRVKALKHQVRIQEIEQEHASKKNSWLSFQNRGAKKKVVGSFKSVRKESIFTSPDSVDGKVGVTGSGRGVTDYGERKKFKLRDT